MRRFIAAAAAIVLACALSPATTQAAIIYDSIASPWTASMGGVAEMGSTITFAGTDRQVTKIEFGLDYPTGDRNIQARVYANDGPDGAPGTQLWASQWIRMPGPGQSEVVQAFNVVGLTVPEKCTVSILDDIPGGTAGMGVYCAKPVVGKVVDQWNRFDGSPWFHFGSDSIQMRITAVPEPATMSLLALGGLAVLRRRR